MSSQDFTEGARQPFPAFGVDGGVGVYEGARVGKASTGLLTGRTRAGCRPRLLVGHGGTVAPLLSADGS